MTVAQAAQRWAAVWKDGWERRDTAAILALYDDAAVLSTAPFRAPHRGLAGVREYVARVFAEEEDPHVAVSQPIVDGDRASVSWWASLREEGVDTTLSGTSVLTFTAAGLVAEQWDTWNVTRERRSPPTAWGPFSSDDPAG